MAYRNHLLFNNIFLRRLAPSSDDADNARHFVHVSAHDWYQAADFSTPARMALTWSPNCSASGRAETLTQRDGNGWLMGAVAARFDA